MGQRERVQVADQQIDRPAPGPRVVRAVIGGDHAIGRAGRKAARRLGHRAARDDKNSHTTSDKTAKTKTRPCRVAPRRTFSHPYAGITRQVPRVVGIRADLSARLTWLPLHLGAVYHGGRVVSNAMQNERFGWSGPKVDKPRARCTS